MTGKYELNRTVEEIVRDARLLVDGPGRTHRDLDAIEALVHEADANAYARGLADAKRIPEMLDRYLESIAGIAMPGFDYAEVTRRRTALAEAVAGLRSSPPEPREEATEDWRPKWLAHCASREAAAGRAEFERTRPKDAIGTRIEQDPASSKESGAGCTLPPDDRHCGHGIYQPGCQDCTRQLSDRARAPA